MRLEGSLSGNSANLITEYLNNILRLFVKEPYTRVNIPALLQDEKTFVFIKRFLKEKKNTLSVTIPPEWYQL